MKLEKASANQFRCQQACQMYIYSDAAFDIHYVNAQGNEIPAADALKAVGQKSCAREKVRPEKQPCCMGPRTRRQQPFEVDFCTAHWKDGQIVEENLFYDVVGLMKQIGLM